MHKLHSLKDLRIVYIATKRVESRRHWHVGIRGMESTTDDGLVSTQKFIFNTMKRQTKLDTSKQIQMCVVYSVHSSAHKHHQCDADIDTYISLLAVIAIRINIVSQFLFVFVWLSFGSMYPYGYSFVQYIFPLT